MRKNSDINSVIGFTIILLFSLLSNCTPPTFTPPTSGPNAPFSFITGSEYVGTGICYNGAGSYVTGTTSISFGGQTLHGGTDAVLIKYDSQGSRVWTKLIGGSGNDAGNSVAYDSSGAIYVAGTTSTNDTSFDNRTNAGLHDAFITKYDVNGNWIWTRFLGGTAEDYGYGVAVDGSGNVYIAGLTYSSFDSQVNQGNSDAFVSEFDSSGTHVRTMFVGSAGYEYYYAVTYDGNGNIYCAGGTTDAVDSQTFAGGSDAMIVKFTASTGVKQWTRLAGGSGNENAFGVAADASDVYAAGNTTSSFNGQTNAGNSDAFMIKYNSAGDPPLWTRFAGGPGIENGREAALDSSGNCYLAGDTTSSFDGQTNAGNYDAFITSWDASGNPRTTYFFGGALYDSAAGIAAGGSTIYITGYRDSNTLS